MFSFLYIVLFLKFTSFGFTWRMQRLTVHNSNELGYPKSYISLVALVVPLGAYF